MCVFTLDESNSRAMNRSFTNFTMVAVEVCFWVVSHFTCDTGPEKWIEDDQFYLVVLPSDRCQVVRAHMQCTPPPSICTLFQHTSVASHNPALLAHPSSSPGPEAGLIDGLMKMRS